MVKSFEKTAEKKYKIKYSKLDEFCKREYKGKLGYSYSDNPCYIDMLIEMGMKQDTIQTVVNRQRNTGTSDFQFIDGEWKNLKKYN